MNIKNLVNYQKLISVMTATCLLVSFVIGPTAASAINNEQTTKEYNQIFREFILPYSYGKITNSHFAGTDRVIINIQDLHCHPKVQKNIANIIETFDKKFGVKKIYLEGAYGDVSTKWIVDKIENNKQIVEQMLDTGRLTGAEYYSALSGKTDLIKGLEEKEPYLDNIKRLGKILQDQENIDLILKSLHECTDKVKKKYYTKRQYKLEKLFNEYKEGKIPSQKYYTLLSKHIDKLGIDLTKYENSLIYVTLLDLQKDLSYKQATRELQELIFVLKQQLPYNAYKSLLENTKNFKEIEKLYSYIIQLDKIYNLNVSSNFKELDKYFRYVELSKKINPVELVKEDEFLIQEINTRFAQTKAQQDVVFLIYFEKYLKDYLTTKITLDDYKYYQENINRYIQVYNKYVDNRVLSLLSGYIRETDKFYNINLDRNTYFTKNIFKEKECLNQIENISSAQDEINKIIDNMQQVKELDIVVTGGFHSQTITELLESQNVSYIVITPNVTDGIKLAEDTYYELAKEQSKIAFQTIAPIIASLSPKMQELLLEKVGNIQQEEIEKIIGLDDNGRAKIISELMAANLLESDDLGYVETTLQNIIKDIVDDLHKEKVTPELISKIKNLQSLLKYKEKLQRVIDLLNEGTAKQAVMLVGDMLTNIYNIFDSFLSFANKTLSQQEQEFSVTDFDTDESFDEDIEKEDIDNVYEKEEIYDDDLDLWFSDADIIKVCREIIKVGKNNKDIKDFIWYLGKYNIADYELLNKILSELKTLNDSKEIQEYCGIIYTLTNKDRITSKEKAIKTKENIMSFFEKPKTLQLKFCNLFSKLFVGHDYLRENFFNALLDFVNKNEYTDKDFDFLLTVCKYSFLISDLGTKENIYDFLTLDMEKRKLLYSFYQSPKMYTDIDINRLTLNFILSVLNKYNFSNEQFDYIMRLVCSANITNTSSEQKYIESLKEKEVNMFVLENFKYIDTYNRYLLDLLFSDVDEKNVENFVSKIQTIVNLFDDLRYYKIDTLETENKGLALSVFLNDVFEKYCKDNNIYDLVKQYQLAIRVSRKMYSILGDNIFTLPGDKTDNIIKETLDYYNKIDKIISSLTLFTNKTAIFSLHNNERNFDRKTFRFTPAGIKEIFKRLDIEPEVFEAVEISFMDKVLDFIKTIKQDEIDKQILFDFVNNLDGSEIIKKDILQYLAKKKESTISKKAINRYVNRLKITERFLEVKHFLSHIEHFNDYGQEKGIFIFDGHGIDDGIFYTENSKITVEQLAQSLINAHNNGVNLENLTLMFSSCHSYKFADNIINELINNGITAFPQIITDAGKETVYGYTTTVDLDGKQTKVSNLFYSLMKYLDSKTPEQLQKMKGRLTFKELADAPRYLSNNTVFVTNQQITKLNRDLEKNIHDIIEENGTDNEENMYSVIKNGTYASSHNQYAQLQLPSTKKALDNLGKNKVIKKIYRAKAGENFKNTRLGVAIGVLMETFVFWLPSFVSKHQFDKTQTSGANAVVWRIKALSIGIGIIPVVLSILNPIIAAFIIPVILLTKSVLQYNYDTQKSRINIRLSKYEKPIVVLIEKNGNRYSLIFSPSSGSVFLSSINEDAFDHETSKYKDSKSIEEFLGIKIKFSKHRLSVKDYNAETNIKFTKYSNISEIAQSLNTQDILSPEQSKIDLIKNDRKCTDVEYVYLDRAEKENRDKIKYAIDNHKLLVLYPFSKTCDIDSLTDEQLCALYLQISTYFINMVDVLLPKDILPRLMDDNSKIKGMEDFLLELIKNAFVYGNLADPSKPIYIDCGKDNFTVYNSYNETEKTSKKRLSFAAMAALSGAHRGLNTIQHYADEALITVTSQEERIRQIGDNKDDKYYAITVERIKPKVEQKKAEQKIKDISRYLKINDFEITRQRFEDVLEYLQNNDYEITEDTYEYIRYFLYVSAVDVGWMISYKFEFFKKLFDLSDSSKKFVYDFCKQNEAEIKGNPNVLSIIINIVKDYDNNQFSEEEFKTLLNLIMQLSDRIGSYVKDKDVHLTEIITNNRVSNFFLQYYLQNKKFFYDKDYKTLIAYLIFSEGTNIEYYAKQTYFDSEIKMLFKNMVEHKIHDLNMFYNGLTMKIYLNPIFKELLEQEYNKNNENLTSLVRYRVALVIAQNLYVHLGEKINLLNEDDINKIMYECVQDIINKKNLLKQRFLFSDESDFMGEENDDGKISFEEGKDFGINKGKASNTGIIGISNSELDENGARFFSLSGIGSVLNFIENTPRLLMNLEVEGTSDVKDKKEKLLKMIEEYIYLKKNYGLSNLVVVINGHGDDYNIYLNGKEYEITRTELAQALLQAYKNGANLEEITLNLAACSSYAFCENLFKTLKSLERNENLEIKLPNIITEAGKEIKPGFGKKIVFRRNVTDTQRITIYIGNAVYSLFMYVKNKIVNNEFVSKYLTLNDVFDSGMYYSNHTIFISGQEVEKINTDFREKLFELLGEDFIKEDEVEKIIKTAQMQLPSTQKILNKFGENFRFTKLGVALGVLIELFSFWGPNFIKNHNFDPSIQTKMTAVVWVIRALSIGIGLGSGVILAAVTVSPFFALFGIPALFLTEIITHYVWNRLVIHTGNKNFLLQTDSKIKNNIGLIFLNNPIIIIFDIIRQILHFNNKNKYDKSVIEKRIEKIENYLSDDEKNYLEKLMKRNRYDELINLLDNLDKLIFENLGLQNILGNKDKKDRDSIIKSILNLCFYISPDESKEIIDAICLLDGYVSNLNSFLGSYSKDILLFLSNYITNHKDNNKLCKKAVNFVNDLYLKNFVKFDNIKYLFNILETQNISLLDIPKEFSDYKINLLRQIMSSHHNINSETVKDILFCLGEYDNYFLEKKLENKNENEIIKDIFRYLDYKKKHNANDLKFLTFLLEEKSFIKLLKEKFPDRPDSEINRLLRIFEKTNSVELIDDLLQKNIIKNMNDLIYVCSLLNSLKKQNISIQKLYDGERNEIIENQNIATENQNIVFIILLSDEFREKVEKLSKEKFDYLKNPINQYKLAISVSRRIAGDFIKEGKILNPQAKDFDKILKLAVTKQLELTERQMNRVLIKDSTKIIGINNNEKRKGEKRFTFKELDFLLDKVKGDKRNKADEILIDSGDDEKDAEIAKEKYLNAIGQLSDKDESVFLFFNGHGDDDFLALVGNNTKVTISVNELGDKLISAHKNGISLDKIFIDLSSCHSYSFARKLEKYLEENLKDEKNIKYPVILTAAGYETPFGYDATPTDSVIREFGFDSNEKVGNEWVGLLSLKIKQNTQTPLTVGDLVKAKINMANNAVFVYDETEGEDEDIRALIRENKDFKDIPQKNNLNKTNIFFRDNMLPTDNFELQLPSTQKILNKFGENFRFTKLGVALGVIVELFSFWGPNFIKNHNFDPSIQTKMTAVVWVIRALSIGIGLGSGVILAAVTVSPFFALFGIPALFLTEIITHYIWNINNIPEILELKESVNPINVEQEVENTGLSQDFIEMVGKNSADNGFISLYDAYSLGRQKNTVRRSLTGRGKIIKNNGYALGISTYYLGNGNVFEPVSGISDSESGINLCTYSDGYYEFQQDGTRIRTNEQYLEKIFEDCEKNNKEVYFFLPPNIYSFNAQDMQKAQQEYMKEHPELQQSISGLGAYQPGITKAEIEWLKKHPQYMKYVHFVVGSYTFLDGNIDKTIFKKYFNINNISKTFSSILSAPRKYMKSGYNLILQNKGVGSKEIEEIQKTQTKINFKNLINDIYKIIGLIEQTTEKYPENREKGMKEAEEILSENFTPEQLEIIDLLASTIFDSIKYVNATRNTSAVEFINIIYSLQNGLFNDNLLPNEGNDLKQHILGMLKHYVDISLQKKDKDNNILVKIIDSDETILNYMTDFLCDIIVKNNLIEKKKQEIEQRKINMKQFIDGVKKDDKKFATVMVCSANENRSAIWHIMFADFLERKNKKNTKVLSAGVFYDLFIRDEIKAKSLVDDYKKTLSQDERYQGINENIINDFKSRYIKYLKIPKNTQLVFIVAGEQHRAQLIKLGYDPNWIFLMSDFYSDDFKKQFKLEHETMGRELEENNVFSMSEFPDPFEKQILRQDLPELVKSLVEYVFKTKDDIIRETLPERFVKFTDDYNQFEHMEDLPSFAFTDDEKREATRELYEDEVSDMVREDHQFEFAANTKYLYILQNRRNKEALLNVLFRNDAELKFKLFALMYLSSIGRAITQQEQESINAEKEKILVEFKNQLETNSFKVLNNFDLRAYMMGIYLMLQGYSARSTVPDIVYKAFIINKDGKVLANSDGYFAGVDLFTIIHELTHVIVGKPGLYNHLAALTVDELVSYITPNMFLSIVKLSLQAYSKMQSNYTIHQTDGVIDYVKMGKKLHVLYNLFSERVGDRELKLEEHIAPIAFLDLLFNAHRRIGKNVDWSELLETIKMIDDERLDQSYMLWTIVTEYTERLVVKGILSQQETKKLLKEMEKMQLWTLLTYDIVQNIKDTDSETYSKILGIKNVISFEEQLLSKPAETKEQLKRISDIIKSKEQLSKNDVLTLLIIDVISNVDYEQLINNFDGVIEGIMNTVKSAAQIFDIQKNTYSVFEYEQISKFVVDNHTIVVSPITDVAENIFEFISNSLNQFFFIKTLLNKVFGTKNLSSIMKDKKLLIATSKQQEENLQQVLQSNGIENIKVVTMEIITKPADGIRSDMVLDVQKGIRARYEDNKLIVYSKQGIDISTEDIQALIMQEYFAERSEDIVDKDVIAFADATDTTLDDITNRLKTSYTASVAMPNKETNFDLSSRVITNLATACKQEFVSTGIKTFIITQKQAEKFVSEIKFLQEEGFRFIISCKSDNIVDITIYDGMVIDATKIVDINQAMKFMDSIKRKVLTQGIAKQISVEFNDNIYNQFDNLKINIIDKYGIMPLLNASSQSLNLRNIGKYEVKNVTENNIDTLLRSNSVIGLVIDNARLFVGKKSIIKQLFSKEHKYNKGYNASLSSKFDYICYDVPALADLLNVDINNEEDISKLKNIDLSKLSLSSDSLTYLEYLQKKGNYEEMAGFIRGIAMNTARTQIIKGLKEQKIDLDMDKFAKEAGGKYQKAFLTVAVQLMMEGIDITKLLETDFIDSNMTVKQYLDSVFERVNINIEDILKQNEYKIQRTENTAKTIEDFKNYVVLLDNLKIVKETSANFDMSIKAVRSVLSAA